MKIFAMILVTLICHLAAAQTAGPDFARWEAREKAVLKAYEGFDPDAHEKLLQELRADYRKLGRFQEELWVLYANDMDQAAQKLEHDLRLQMKLALVVEKESLRGQELLKVKLDNGMVAVLRRPPRVAVGESDSELPTDSFVHDVVAYEIDRALGFHLVPVTVLTNYEGVNASLQAYVWEMKAGDVTFTRYAYQDERLHILDFLTQQIDRHAGNWGVAAGGHLVALDNNMIYGTSLWREKRAVINHVPAFDPPASLRPENRRAVERLKREIDAGNFDRTMAIGEILELRKRAEILLRLPHARPGGGGCGPLLDSK